MRKKISYSSPLFLLALWPSSGPSSGPGGGPSAGGDKAAAKAPGISVKQEAGRLDRLVALDLRRARLEPHALVDDATFLRRAYLGIIGRIPTGKETEAFLSAQGQDKRAKLVDDLLDSPGFDSHMFNWWADLLRVKSRMNGRLSGEPFIHYLKESVAQNKSFDQMAREMVTATGAAHERGNGATGLLMRDRGMPLDSMANTVRVFLGTRLECAQCHNHPFDKWKQKDFYAMAAFAGGIQYRQNLAANKDAGALRKVSAQLRQQRDRNALRGLNFMMRGATEGIAGSGTGKIRLPKDYAYEDARPRETIEAHAIFGKTPKIKYPKAERRKNGRTSWRERQKKMRQQRARRGRNNSVGPQVDSRAAFADWLTDKDNPRFAKTIANRMWKRVMGRGLIEPVDNMMDSSEPSNEALMKRLETLMVKVKFDLKEFLRVLYHTELFQREAHPEDVPGDQKYYFQGPILRRMTAEQVWDSMLTFAREDVDTFAAPGQRAEPIYRGYETLMGMDEQELMVAVDRAKLRYSNPEKFRREQAAQRRAVQQKRRAAARKMQEEMRAKLRPLYARLSQARRQNDEQAIAELKKDFARLGYMIDKRGRPRRIPQATMMGGRYGRGRGGNTLARASELPAPAPDGHFLRQFGQSDREQIQASHVEANVPQVLSLLNGFIEKRVLGLPSSPLMQAIYSQQDDKGKIRQAYLGVLNREPGGRELAVWQLEMERGGRKVIKDLVWTLCNSHEFRFIQ